MIKMKMNLLALIHIRIGVMTGLDLGLCFRHGFFPLFR